MNGSLVPNKGDATLWSDDLESVRIVGKPDMAGKQFERVLVARGPGPDTRVCRRAGAREMDTLVELQEESNRTHKDSYAAVNLCRMIIAAPHVGQRQSEFSQKAAVVSVAAAPESGASS